RRGGGWFATEVEIWFEDTQVFRPDIAGWRRGRLAEPPREGPIMGGPDWVCEILSKNRRNDPIKKKRVYHRHEVGYYWIVDPIEETLAVHRCHGDGYVETLAADRDERIRAEPFQAMDFRVGVLFGEDDEE